MTERDANNRKIAEWLIPNFCGDRTTTGNSSFGYRCATCKMSIHGHVGGLYDQRHTIPDFYTDEYANAMLLDAMQPDLEFIDDAWSVHKETGDFEINAEHADRKTAICEAFIAWKEKP